MLMSITSMSLWSIAVISQKVYYWGFFIGYTNLGKHFSQGIIQFAILKNPLIPFPRLLANQRTRRSHLWGCNCLKTLAFQKHNPLNGAKGITHTKSNITSEQLQQNLPLTQISWQRKDEAHLHPGKTASTLPSARSPTVTRARKRQTWTLPRSCIRQPSTVPQM